MGKNDPGVQTQQTKIDPKLQGASNTLVDMLMAGGAINPWDKEYTGPRMAPINQQQQEVMQGTADAGNAFNMGFTSAAGSLPPTTMINGMPAYDSLALAKQGMPPALTAFYDKLYGDDGILAQYRLENLNQPTTAAPTTGKSYGQGREFGEGRHERGQRNDGSSRSSSFSGPGESARQAAERTGRADNWSPSRAAKETYDSIRGR